MDRFHSLFERTGRAASTEEGAEIVGIVSVVVPAHNEAERIGRQLDALSGQTYIGDWELVVADNGSTDGTVAAALAYASRLPLRVVDAAGRCGPAAARNVGAREARGELLLFCDADDRVADDWVEQLVRALEADDLVAGAIVHTYDGTPVHPSVPSAPPSLLRWLPYAQTANCGVRRACFSELGGFPEDLTVGEDVAFSWSAQLAGRSFGYAATAVVSKEARASLRAQFRQYVAYGSADVDLYLRFRDAGVPGVDLAGCARTYGGLLVRLPLLLDHRRRAPWVRQAGRRLGRLIGSARRRVLYP